MSKAQSVSYRRLRKQKGFSLIEFGLVMIVSGLMITGALGVYTSYMKKAKLEASYKRLYDTNTMLAETWRVEDRYFCPADPTLPASDPAYGRENCAAAVAVGSCTNGTTGVCVSAGRDAGGGETRVLAGMLPFRDISDKFNAKQASMERQLVKAKDPALKEELRQAMNRAKKTWSLSAKELAFDGWGKQFTYVVSAAWTAPMDDANPVLRNGGSIIIHDDQGSDIAPRGAHFALISHGENGDGAYDAQGKLVGKACADLGAVEQDNCNGDATVVRAPVHTLAQTAAKTDDLVAYNVATSNEVWERVSCGTDDKDLCLRNRNVNNVAIAASTASEKLTVGGSMRAEKLDLTAKFADGLPSVCDDAGGNCFSPSYIGGTKMDACDPSAAASKWVAVQVGPSGNAPGVGVPSLKCQNVNMQSYGFSCPAGEIVYGFTGSQPDCVDPCASMDGTTDTQTHACPAGMSGSQTCTATYSCATRSYSPYVCSSAGCTYDPVDAVCGQSSGKNMLDSPTENLCNVGTLKAPGVTGTGPWAWTCEGAHGGADAACSANKPVNGECGAANQTAVTATPTGGDLCNFGAASGVTGSNPYEWTCTGTYEGTSALCATLAPTSVDGTCGSSNGGTYASVPTDLCASGTAGAVTTGATTYTWACTGGGTPVGTDASCSANRATTVNGACGSANGVLRTSPPVVNLCSAGAPSSVTTGASDYTWSCAGGGAPVGSSASCSAPRGTTVNGACQAYGSYYGAQPASSTGTGCSSGTYADAADTGAQWQWSCTGGGTPVGSTVTCSANKDSTVNGACQAYGSYYAAQPASNTGTGCSSGTYADAVDTGTQWQWSCTGGGLPAGTTASCAANKDTSVAGTCKAYGSYYAAQPASSTGTGCTTGTYADAVDTGTQWQWSCAGGGTPVGATATCSANKDTTINGACQAYGSYYGAQPASNTGTGCSSGTYADAADTGTQWKWSCAGGGSPAGTTASCVANKDTSVAGVCKAYGSYYAAQPASSTATGCTTGAYADAVDTGTQWQWSCAGSGTPTGATVACSANKDTTINGACQAYGSYYGAQPASSTANGCTNGTYTDVADTGTQWKWSCDGGGTPTGTTASCVANKNTSVNGACRNYIGNYPAQPATSTGSGCTAGAYADMGEVNGVEWRWSCVGTGTPAGTTATCYADRTTSVAGECKVYAGTYASQPATNNATGCEVGTYDDMMVIDTAGKWKWQCKGTGTPAGGTATCTADR